MENGQLSQELEQGIQSLSEQRGAALATAVSPIIFTNLDKGRIHKVSAQEHCSPTDYVWRVADKYQQWHEYLHAVQIERRTDVWQPLFEQLQTWAFRLLPRIGFPDYFSRDERLREAQTCATEAAVALLNAYFPYDVDFEPWAYIFLQHVARKQMERRIRPRLEVQNNEIEIDAWENWLHNLSDPEGERGQQLIELRADLLKYIDQLASDARRQFILLYYFEEKSFEEIAALMGKSANALYKLHSDALENLRKIWRENRDKYE